MSTSTNTLDHETDVPSLGTKARINAIDGPCHTKLSFAVPLSMAFFKRLTWEQTPWTIPPISPSEAQIISFHTRIPVEAIQNALPFGVSYDSKSNAQKKHYPRLYVLCHRLRRNLTRDPKFLEFWHNDVVKPAFDRAWEESGLVQVFGMPTDWQSKLNGRWGEGTWTECAADPASKMVKILSEGRDTSVHATWPEYTDALERGPEGQWSVKRCKIWSDAWESIKGMLSSRGTYMQDPLLLAVWDQKANCEDATEMMEGMGHLWDKYADSRFVNDTWLTVHLEPGSVAFPDR